MARGETSRVTFDIKVSGVDEAKELSQLMPKIIRQFDELEKKLQSVRKAQESPAGGAGGGGGRSGSSRQDISERIIGMELGVIKDEIDSVQRLSTEYASLVNQINAYERAGNSANSLRVRAEKQHQKLRKIIQDRDTATQKLTTTVQGISKSDHEWSGVMRQTEVDINQLSDSTMRSAEAIATQSDTYRNSSYVVLNAGYLMQDSPYGFRGISNNISQLVQSWELLNRRTMEMNMTNNENVSTWQALRKDLTGRMGMIFLIGSALPAALVLAQKGWDLMKKSSEDAKDELQEIISSIEAVRKASSSFRDLEGDDPLGLNQIESQVSEGKWADSWFRQVERLEGKYQDLNVAISGSGDSFDTTTGKIAIHNKEMQAIRDEINAIESLVENSGWALNVEQTTERLEELGRQYDLIRKRAESEDPFLLSFRQLSREVEGTIRMFELAQDKLSPEWFTEKSEAELLEDAERVGALLAKAIAEGHGAEAEKYKELLDSIRSAMGDDGDEDWFEDQYNSRSQAFQDLLNLRIFQAEHELDTAKNTQTSLLAAEKLYYAEREMLRTEDFSSQHAKRQAEEALLLEHNQRITEIERDQLLFELEMQNFLAEEGIDGATTLNDRLDGIEDYYDRRERIIRESIEHENELKEALFFNDKDRQEEVQRSEEEWHQARMQLIQQTAQFTVTTAQATANFLTEDREAHFRINQVASASMAIINAHLAFAQTIGQTGFFGIPLAKIALASGYAQAALIMSQKFRGRGGGRGFGGGGFSALTSYRGFEFNEGSTSMFSSESYTPFSGSKSVSTENASMEVFPEKVQAEFTDGFGNVVSKGILKLHSEGRKPGRYWQDV